MTTKINDKTFATIKHNSLNSIMSKWERQDIQNKINSLQCQIDINDKQIIKLLRRNKTMEEKVKSYKLKLDR